MKSISKVLAILSLFVAAATTVSAQADGAVGIGTRIPNSSSILDVVATDKGVLLPRVALSGLTDQTTVSSPVESMIVYNTATVTGATGVVPGYYYWSVGKWRRLIVDADVANGLTVTNGKITLGGKLDANTEIDVDGKTLSIKGLGTGATTDNIVVSDATTGTLKKIAQTNAVSLTGNSLTTTVNDKPATVDLSPVTLSGDISGALNATAIGDDKVTTLKIKDGAVTTAKLLNDAVTSGKIKDGEIVNADINASAAIEDSKLATIATSGKVSNSATTATAANTGSSIVSRDVNGDFSAGTITAVNDVAVNGGDLTTDKTTATVFNSNATTVNVGGAATALNLGAATGTTTVNNSLSIAGTTTLNGDVTLAANKNFTQNGTGTFTTGTGAVALKGATTIDGATTLNSSLSVTGATALKDDATLSAGKKMTFTGATSGTVGLIAPTTVTDYTLTLPSASAALSGQVLTSSDALGNLTWSSIAPVEVGTTANNTLRWDGSKWAESTALTNDGTDIAASGKITATGNVAVNGGDLTTTSTGTATVFNTNATTLNVGGAATALNLGATTGTTTVNNSLSVNKNFNVSGSTGLGLTTISSSVSTSTPLSSVDSYSGVIITQTSTIGNYTLPTPTGTTPIGRIFKVVNASGSNSRINVGVGPYSIPVGKSAEFIWDGTAWSEPASTSSVSSLVSITANYTVGASDNTVVLRKTAIGSVMVTLPSSNIQNGQIYRFINMSSAYDINLSASFRSSNLETSSRIGVGASNIDGGVAGNKVTIQWDADTAEWLQVGN